jgi:hypothetical protein
LVATLKADTSFEKKKHKLCHKKTPSGVFLYTMHQFFYSSPATLWYTSL